VKVSNKLGIITLIAIAKVTVGVVMRIYFYK